MKFIPQKIYNSFIVEIEKNEDERGFFARTYDIDEFKKYGLNSKIVQCNINYTKKKGTVKGLHYQKSPFEEAKLIRCIRGSVYSVIVDLRPDSPTYKQSESIILSENEYCWRYIPELCANGIQTLEDDTEIIYQVTQFYTPESEGGIRWNDPSFKIKWPLPSQSISKKDQSWQNFLV
ncbi:dTDP-4-dehydrorhamnose 3,5-epimerase family protein [Nitrosopumilus sp.]|nr:dTDP-4-dehydrorhamnose 3,5-epimerase family protein [Nitrosopumilus sp.]